MVDIPSLPQLCLGVHEVNPGPKRDGLFLVLDRKKDINAYAWRTHGPASETAGFILLHPSAAMRGCEHEFPG
jgi:hypothetical protein